MKKNKKLCSNIYHHKLEIAKMIVAGEYKEGIPIEWLSFAAGIYDVELTSQLLQELKENPLKMVFDKEKGWIIVEE